MSHTKSLLLALLAISLVIFPTWQYMKVAERVEGFVSDVGTVVGHVKKESDFISSRPSHTESFSSIISYQGANGDAETFTSTVARFPATPVGTKVSILVKPIERTVAYEADPLGIWLGVTVSVGISLGLGLFLAFVVYLKTKSKASFDEKA